jgi:alpha-D-ribose 1-methylphosphonate 5-triphosphate synthase subunit PhnG
MEREEINFFLQHADLDDLAALCRKIEGLARVLEVKKPTPQTLLVPVTDPVNGGTFYGGEVLVTSALVQVDGANGWSMVMDDNPELAYLVAVLDAAIAAGIALGEIYALAGRGQAVWTARAEQDTAAVRATRVAFELL